MPVERELNVFNQLVKTVKFNAMFEKTLFFLNQLDHVLDSSIDPHSAQSF